LRKFLILLALTALSIARADDSVIRQIDEAQHSIDEIKETVQRTHVRSGRAARDLATDSASGTKRGLHRGEAPAKRELEQ
jgi:hypothetical protein